MIRIIIAFFFYCISFCLISNSVAYICFFLQRGGNENYELEIMYVVTTSHQSSTSSLYSDWDGTHKLLSCNVHYQSFHLSPLTFLPKNSVSLFFNSLAVSSLEIDDQYHLLVLLAYRSTAKLNYR